MDFEKVVLLLNAGFTRDEIINMINAGSDGATEQAETGGDVIPSAPPADQPQKKPEKITTKDMADANGIADAIASAVASAITKENEKLEKMFAKFSLTVAGSNGEEKPNNSWESILGELINPPGLDK